MILKNIAIGIGIGLLLYGFIAGLLFVAALFD